VSHVVVVSIVLLVIPGEVQCRRCVCFVSKVKNRRIITDFSFRILRQTLFDGTCIEVNRGYKNILLKTSEKCSAVRSCSDKSRQR
jgi:hypothetical protein